MRVCVRLEKVKLRSMGAGCCVGYLGPHSKAVIRVRVLITLTCADVIKVASLSRRVLYTHKAGTGLCTRR